MANPMFNSRLSAASVPTTSVASDQALDTVEEREVDGVESADHEVRVSFSAPPFHQLLLYFPSSALAKAGPPAPSHVAPRVCEVSAQCCCREEQRWSDTKPALVFRYPASWVLFFGKLVSAGVARSGTSSPSRASRPLELTM